MDKTSLGNRMKNNYENRSRHKLMRRTPVILRLDGVAFHTFTRKFNKPFDEDLMEAMARLSQKLMDKIQGAKFAYTQSDEISILLTDYDKLTTDAWFDYNLQKITSVAASMASLFFNDHMWFVRGNSKVDSWKDNRAFFDCRAFNLPKEEVTNYFIWRQQDATRNSIQMVGQHHFSQKQLHKKSCDKIQDMLFKEKHINWNDLETPKKRGTAIYKKAGDPRDNLYPYSSFMIDKDIPIFTKDRDFVEKWVHPEE